MSIDDFFGPAISTYTRAHAIADGTLVDLMQGNMAEVARQHYKFPVACTAAVFDIMRKAVENKRYANDYAGVLHDMLWMSRCNHQVLTDAVVAFQVIITGAGRRRLFAFKLAVGPGDHGEPVITIMLPDEG